jgi:hypothetical protein
MSRAIQKFLENEAILLAGENEKKFYQMSFDVMGELTTDQREELRLTLARIDEETQDRLHQIESRDWGQNITVSASDAPARVGYGKSRVGGVRSFITADEGETGAFLHQFITLFNHSILKYDDLYLDGQLVTFGDQVDANGHRTFLWSTGDWAGTVFFSAVSKGATNQAANFDLVSQSSLLFPDKWTENHRQRGCAGIYLITFYDSDKFISGPPEIAVEGHWKNSIFDPRTGLYGWTNNAALCLADYLTNQDWGVQFTLDDIDMESLEEAADICDELVGLDAGGTEKRYTVNGSFDLSSGNSHERIKQDLELAMGGRSVFVGGKWKFYPAKWRMPVKALNQSHFRSDLKIQIKPKVENIKNGVKGLFRSPENLWEMSEYPAVKNEFYRTQDGSENWEEVDLVFVTSSAQAQRIAKIMLEDGRQWITVSGEFSIETISLTPMDNITLTYPKLGWDEKAFQVLSVDSIVQGSKVETLLLLKETAESIYEWDAEETIIDLAPNTNLPNPSIVVPPVGLTVQSGTAQLDIRSDGTIFSRALLSWVLSTDSFVLSGGFHEIQFKKSSSATWIPSGVIGGRETSFFILDVQDGEQYDFRVRAKTTLGVSAWVSAMNHFVEGKTAIPTTPLSFSAILGEGGISLSWSEIPDKDLKEYEIRLGDTWATAETIYLGRTTNFLFSRPFSTGAYKFLLRAIDSTGNLSNIRTFDLNILPPNVVTGINGVSIFNMVRLTWAGANAGSFPIAKYRIRKGASFIGSQAIGEASATIIALQEAVSGLYTYWVTAVDIYGNEGPENSVSINLKSFTFLELITDAVLPVSTATLDNAMVENDRILAPVNLTETWEDHFIDNSWSSPDDQVTAGYPLYIQPTITNAEAVFIYDFGSEISSAQIVFSYLSNWISGSGTLDNTVAYSDDGISWTSESGLQALGEDFRYARLTIDMAGASDTSLIEIHAVRISLSVVTEEDYGTVSAVSSDGSGTLITTNKDFLDVFEGSISLVYNGSNAYFPGFTITGNEVRVFLWNTSGSRVSGNVSWRLTGIVAD